MGLLPVPGPVGSVSPLWLVARCGGPRRAGAGKTLVGRDDGLALRIMSGDDAAYFECHGFPLYEIYRFGRVAFDGFA